MATSQPTKSAPLTAVPTSPKTTKPAAARKPKPTAEPKINLGLSQTPTWRPVVIMPGGKKLTCPHQKYGHESEGAAKKCSRTLIAQATTVTKA